jgi:hypothetical protein
LPDWTLTAGIARKIIPPFNDWFHYNREIIEILTA